MRRTALLVIALIAALIPGSALAQEAESSSDGNFTLRVNETLRVAAGERLDAVVVINGDVEVEGTVESALVVIRGTATVRDGGELDGTVTVVNGDLVLDAGSTVNNVSLVRSDLAQDPGATVRGDIDRTSRVLFLGRGAAMLAGFLLWIGATLAVLAAGTVFALIGARQLATSAAYMTAHPGPSILAGFVLAIGLPILAVILIVTLIGIPAGIGLLLFVMPALFFLGYLVAGTWLGSLILSRTGVEQERPVLPALLGLGLFQIFVLIPVIGWALFPVAGIWGTGALAYYIFNALRRRPQGPEHLPAAEPA